MAAHYARQRRTFSLLMSSQWVGYGATVILTVDGPPKSLSWLPNVEIGSHLSGMFFILLGIVTAVLAYESRDYPRLEHICYGILVAGPVLMGALSMIAAALDYSDLGWASGFRFFMFGAIAYFVAGLKPSDAEMRKRAAIHVHR